MSGKFVLHFQEHVVVLEVLTSHGTFLEFACSGWVVSDISSHVC